MDSILNSVKEMLGLDPEDTVYDTEIIAHVNAVFMHLMQIGVGPKEGFQITGDTETWNDFHNGRIDLGALKTYIWTRVKILFDPPSSSFVLDAQKNLGDEMEWRLYANEDTGGDTGG
ncbi:MAG: hypothetical protein J6X26_00210 [Bacteroidales bacterium]|nr:hypothetical protein [Bacteroidales bacterium]